MFAFPYGQNLDCSLLEFLKRKVVKKKSYLTQGILVVQIFLRVTGENSSGKDLDKLSLQLICLFICVPYLNSS